MKKWLILGVVSFFVLACDEQSVTVEEFPNWVKISVPGGREAFAIAGDIEETLLVATQSKAFYTTDMGQTWIESTDFQGPVKAFLHRQDTIVALFNERKNEAGIPVASTGYLYTLDFGKNWVFDESGKYLKATAAIGVAESEWGVKYRIKISTETAGVNPSFIEKWPYTNNNWGALDFPVKIKANNLYLDGKQRLYVAASSGSFNEENCLMSPSEKSPAWVFISKRPLPQ